MTTYKFLRISCTIMGFGGIVFLIAEKGISSFIQYLGVFFCVLVLLFGYTAPNWLDRIEKSREPYQNYRIPNYGRFG